MNKNGHVLIIDDSEDLQFLLKSALEGEDYRVSSAMNGQEGLEILDSLDSPPTIILLDLMMPVKNGYEFRKEQIANPKYADIPVIVMTSSGNEETDLHELRPKEYLQKPVDLDLLLQVVERDSK